MPDPLLKLLELKIVAALDPMITANGLQGISVYPITGGEELPRILDKYRDKMPGAVLSLPLVQFAEKGARLLDATLSYGLLVGITARKAVADRNAQAYDYFEQAARHLSFVQLKTAGDGIAANLDYVRLRNWEPAEIEGAGAIPIFVSYLTFEIGVRNWRVND